MKPWITVRPARRPVYRPYGQVPAHKVPLTADTARTLAQGLGGRVGFDGRRFMVHVGQVTYA